MPEIHWWTLFEMLGNFTLIVLGWLLLLLAAWGVVALVRWIMA